MRDKRSGPGPIMAAIRRAFARHRARQAGRKKAEAWRRDEVFPAEQRRRPSLRYMI